MFSDSMNEETVRKLIFLCDLLDGWKRATMVRGRECLSLYSEHRTCAPDSRWCEMERQHLCL